MQKLSIKKIKTFINQTPVVIVNDVVEKLSAKKIKIHKFFVLKLIEPKNLRLRTRCKVREGTYEDIDEMAELEKKSRDVFLKRFRDGDICFVSINSDRKVIGYAWCTRKEFHTEERFNYCLLIPDDAIYAYDGFIDKNYRLSGIWVALQYKILEKARQEQKKYIITMVDCDNYNSINSQLRFGYQIHKKVYLFKCKEKCFSKEIFVR